MAIFGLPISYLLVSKICCFLKFGIGGKHKILISLSYFVYFIIGYVILSIVFVAFFLS